MTTTPSTPGSSLEADFNKVESAAIASEDEAIIKQSLGIDLHGIDLNDANGIANRIVTSLNDIRGRLAAVAGTSTLPDAAALTGAIQNVLNGVRNDASEEEARKLKARGIVDVIMRMVDEADLQAKGRAGSIITAAIVTNLETGSANSRGRTLAVSMINERPELAKMFEVGKPQATLTTERNAARDALDLFDRKADVVKKIDEFEQIVTVIPVREDLADVQEFLKSINVLQQGTLSSIIYPTPPKKGDPPLPAPSPKSVTVTGKVPGSASDIVFPYVETPADVGALNAKLENLKKELLEEEKVFKDFNRKLRPFMTTVNSVLPTPPRTRNDLDEVADGAMPLTRDVLDDTKGILSALRTSLAPTKTKATLEDELKKAEEALKNFDPTKRAPEGDVAQRRVVVEYLKLKGLNDAEAQQAANYMLVRTNIDSELRGAGAQMAAEATTTYRETAYVEPDTLTLRRRSDEAVVRELATRLGAGMINIGSATAPVYAPQFAGLTPNHKLQAYFLLQRMFSGAIPNYMRIQKGAVLAGAMSNLMTALTENRQVIELLAPQLRDSTDPTVKALYRRYVENSISRAQMKQLIESVLRSDPPPTLVADVETTYRQMDQNLKRRPRREIAPPPAGVGGPPSSATATARDVLNRVKNAGGGAGKHVGLTALGVGGGLAAHAVMSSTLPAVFLAIPAVGFPVAIGVGGWYLYKGGRFLTRKLGWTT